MDEPELLCIECLGPATIQFVNEQGMPCGTLCTECDASYQKMRERLSELLRAGVQSGDEAMTDDEADR